MYKLIGFKSNQLRNKHMVTTNKLFVPKYVRIYCFAKQNLNQFIQKYGIHSNKDEEKYIQTL